MFENTSITYAAIYVRNIILATCTHLRLWKLQVFMFQGQGHILKIDWRLVRYHLKYSEIIELCAKSIALPLHHYDCKWHGKYTYVTNLWVNITISAGLFNKQPNIIHRYPTSLRGTGCHWITQPGVAAPPAAILDGRVIFFSFLALDLVAEEGSTALVDVSATGHCWGGASHLPTGSRDRTGLLPRILSISLITCDVSFDTNYGEIMFMIWCFIFVSVPHDKKLYKEEIMEIFVPKYIWFHSHKM